MLPTRFPRSPDEGNLQRYMPSHHQDRRAASPDLWPRTIWRGGDVPPTQSEPPVQDGGDLTSTPLDERSRTTTATHKKPQPPRTRTKQIYVTKWRVSEVLAEPDLTTRQEARSSGCARGE